MVMDFLAAITTQRTYDRFDLIDASFKMVV
jgi:hypothetical protein